MRQLLDLRCLAHDSERQLVLVSFVDIGLQLAGQPVDDGSHGPVHLHKRCFGPSPTDFENVGRISVIADPQGATFAIFKAAAQRASA